MSILDPSKKAIQEIGNELGSTAMHIAMLRKGIGRRIYECLLNTAWSGSKGVLGTIGKIAGGTAIGTAKLLANVPFMPIKPKK